MRATLDMLPMQFNMRHLQLVVTSSGNANQLDFLAALRATLCRSAGVDLMITRASAFNERSGLHQLQAVLQCRDQLYLASRVDLHSSAMLRAFAALRVVLKRQFNTAAANDTSNNNDDDDDDDDGDDNVGRRA